MNQLFSLLLNLSPPLFKNQSWTEFLVTQYLHRANTTPNYVPFPNTPHHDRHMKDGVSFHGISLSSSSELVAPSSPNSTNQSGALPDVVRMREWTDILVFTLLETLAILAIVGNGVLICVIFKFRHYEKPSFVLITSLAAADIVHGTVCASYFYPPIALGVENHLVEWAYKVMNVLDWTSWGITLTHMALISLDRLFAITLMQRYSSVKTAKRVRLCTSLCWSVFLCLNISLLSGGMCCSVVPQPAMYSFHFQTKPHYLPLELISPNSNNTSSVEWKEWDPPTNVFPLIYIPLEVTVMMILAFSNPLTLFKLYRKHQSKKRLHHPGMMLMTMGPGLGNMARRQALPGGVELLLSRDVKMILQIVVVTAIFFTYMLAYYLCFYLLQSENLWTALFNSFFYSLTHALNPIVYFSLNSELRCQMKTLFLLCKKPQSPTTVAESQPLLQHFSQKKAAAGVVDHNQLIIKNTEVMESDSNLKEKTETEHTEKEDTIYIRSAGISRSASDNPNFENGIGDEANNSHQPGYQIELMQSLTECMSESSLREVFRNPDKDSQEEELLLTIRHNKHRDIHEGCDSDECSSTNDVFL